MQQEPKEKPMTERETKDLYRELLGMCGNSRRPAQATQPKKQQ